MFNNLTYRPKYLIILFLLNLYSTQYSFRSLTSSGTPGKGFCLNKSDEVLIYFQ